MTSNRTWVTALLTACALLAVAGLVPGAVSAQPATPPATLSLEEALELARRMNPDYLAAANDAKSADWAVREAWGGLLPGASLSSSFSWQDAGQQRIGIFTGEDFGLGSNTSYYSSSYSIGLNYQLNGSRLLAPSRERANRQATEAGIAASRHALEADVTRGYLALMRARDNVALAEEELARADENLRLAQARAQVGAIAELEARQAEVERGRTEVALLQARNQAEADRLALMQVLGIEIDRDVELTTEFTLEPLTWSAEELIAMAMQSNPDLAADRAVTRAAETGVKMARTAYLPSLSMSAGFSGYAREAGNPDFLLNQARSQIAGQREACVSQNMLSERLVEPLPGYPLDCSAIVLTPEQERRILESNSVFPFGWSREPLGVSLTLSLPVFQGFTRERQIEEAKVAADDARYRLRSDELRIRTAVSTAYNEVETARQAVELEERNRVLAEDQLRLARERYRLGAASFLELREAEAVMARADRDYLAALYQYHEGLATLGAAVGRSLLSNPQEQ